MDHASSSVVVALRDGGGGAIELDSVTVKNVLEGVKRHVAEVCALEPGAIREDARLVEYGMDSVRAIDLLVALEHEFQIEIPDREVPRLQTVKDVVAYIDGKLRA
jgi:acyl carrier protein